MQCLHARRGVIDKTSQGFKAGQTVIDCLKDKQYRFLGAPEQLLQDQKLALETAAKTYLQRLSVIWSSPLSDMNRVTASNQLALPVLTYLMWSQHWNLTDLRNIDREARKVISENGGKHHWALQRYFTCLDTKVGVVSYQSRQSTSILRSSLLSSCTKTKTLP